MTGANIAESNLFKPLALNNKINLLNRLVFPPLTRSRATPEPEQVPSQLQLQYYDDRSKEPGSLLISEGTFVSLGAGGWRHAPGIWSDRQLAAWKIITDKVHENKSFISVQLWNLGNQADVSILSEVGEKFKSASAEYISKESEQQAIKLGNPLTALTTQEVKDYVKYYGKVAANSIHKAGFDLVEIHSAHGYLFDQFFQVSSNKRTDEYGGSIENRSRFFLEVVDEIIKQVGADKVAARLSPWATLGTSAGADSEIHPIAQFGYIVSELEKRRKAHGGFGYLSIVEPRVNGNVDAAGVDGDNSFIYEIFKGIIVRAGSYGTHFDSLVRDVNHDERTLIAIGRQAIANPDLAYRLKNHLELTPYNRDTFYTFSDWGYNSYGTYKEGTRLSEEEASKILPKPLA